MPDFKSMSDEDLVYMICGVCCRDDPYVSIEDLRNEILLRLKRGNQ